MGGPFVNWQPDIRSRKCTSQQETHSASYTPQEKDVLCLAMKNWTEARREAGGCKSGKHHCRSCGYVFCEHCAPFRTLTWQGKIDHLNVAESQRLCQKCLEWLNSAADSDNNVIDIGGNYELQYVA